MREGTKYAFREGEVGACLEAIVMVPLSSSFEEKMDLNLVPRQPEYLSRKTKINKKKFKN